MTKRTLKVKKDIYNRLYLKIEFVARHQKYGDSFQDNTHYLQHKASINELRWVLGITDREYLDIYRTIFRNIK